MIPNEGIDLFEALAFVHDRASGYSVPVRFAETWKVEPCPSGQPAIVGRGLTRLHGFGPAEQLEALQYLAAADWLDNFLPGVARPPVRKALPHLVSEFVNMLGQLGAVTLASAPEKHRRHPRFWLGPEGKFIGSDGCVYAPTSVLEDGGLVADPALFVDALPAMMRLAQLRFAFRWILMRGGPERQEASRQILSLGAPFQMLEPALSEAPSDLEDRELLLTRLYFLAQIQQEPVLISHLPPNDRGPMKLVPRAVSPQQQLWILLAGSAGVLDLGGPPSQVHTCEYHVCRKLFLGDRATARGTNRFCSPECGKKHWATLSTRKARGRRKHAHGANGNP